MRRLRLPRPTSPPALLPTLAALALHAPGFALPAPGAPGAPGAPASAATAATGARTDDFDDVDRLEEWPELESKTKTGKEISRLRKARTDEMGEQAAEVLVEMGASTAPLLIKALGKEKDEDARERLIGVLDRICGDAHTRLLAREFENDSIVVRTWAFGRVAATPDPGVAKAAEAALARTTAVEDPDAEQRAERFAAALCATSTGSHAGLDVLYEEAQADWGASGAAIRRSLEVVRGREAAERFWTLARDEDRKRCIAAIRMLAGCGEKERARDLLPALDDSDNSVRVAAINALRGIVDGDPPLDKLATFTAIEMALEWKQRL